MNKQRKEEIIKNINQKKAKNYPNNNLCFFEFFVAFLNDEYKYIFPKNLYFPFPYPFIYYFFLYYFFCLIVFINDINTIDYVGERYNDIKNVSGEYLSIIYKNKSLINNTKYIDLFYLSFFKFEYFEPTKNF